MIRFSCTHCGRDYLLPDALTHLPLLCKGCGQRVVVPEPQPEPPPPPPTPPRKPAPPPKAEPAATPTEAKTITAAPLEATAFDIDGAFLSSATLAKLDVPLEVTHPPVPEPAPPEKPPAPTPKPAPSVADVPAPDRSRKMVAGAADAVVALILLAVGVMVGEKVTGQSTREVLRSAETATRFPTIDLLVWIGCAAFFVLVYGWLGTRGWTVGGWLKRRA